MSTYGYGAMLSPIIRRIQRRIGPGDRCGWRRPPISKEGSQSDEGQRKQQQQDTQNGGFVEVPFRSFKDDTCRHDASFPSDVSTNHDHGTDLSNGSAKRQHNGMVDATSRQTHLEKKPLTRADSHGFQYVTNILFNLRKCTPGTAPNQRKNKHGLSHHHRLNREQQVKIAQWARPRQQGIHKHTHHHGR